MKFYFLLVITVLASCNFSGTNVNYTDLTSEQKELVSEKYQSFMDIMEDYYFWVSNVRPEIVSTTYPETTDSIEYTTRERRTQISFRFNMNEDGQPNLIAHFRSRRSYTTYPNNTGITTRYEDYITNNVEFLLHEIKLKNSQECTIDKFVFSKRMALRNMTLSLKKYMNDNGDARVRMIIGNDKNSYRPVNNFLEYNLTQGYLIQLFEIFESTCEELKAEQ